MNHRTFFVKLAVLALALIFSNTVSGKASENPIRQDTRPALTFCATEPPGLGSFPDVNVVFRAFDQNLNPINDLSPKEIRISENGQSPIPLQNGVQINSNDLGIDFHIIINKGNRTDQSIVRDVLNTFLRYYDQNKDQVFIYTDDGNSLVRYYTPGVGIPLTQVVTEFPTDRVPGYRVMDTAVRGVLSDIEADKNKCQRQKFMFLLMGDEAISGDNFSEYSERALIANTKIIVFHVPTKGSLDFEDAYRSFAEQSSGLYVSIVNDEVSKFFGSLAAYRQTYEAKFRSTSGESGQRVLSFYYQGLNYPDQGIGSYSISLLPPQVTVVIPSIVERTALEVADVGYIYDIKDVDATIQVTFPDQFPRGIETIALIFNQPGKPELRIPVDIISSTGDTYKFKWPLGDIGDSRQTDLFIKAELVDELDIVATSPDASATVISHVPLTKVVQRYYLYLAVGVILVLLVMMALMWRRIKNSAVGQRITSVVENVRKTLVGGGPRGKPLASLRIIDGPQNMINQELKIYTESVKLGRDPQKADMTFYSPEAKSSISGLHARIERVNGSWRIVAVSQSGSETFIDDNAIPFNEPQPLQNGKTVRLGYLAQQPIVFIFSTLIADSPSRITDVRKTEIETEYRKTDISGETIKSEPSQIKPQPQRQEDVDNIFDEFRNRK